MIGEFLYGLTAKDVATQPVIQRSIGRISTSATATQVNSDTPAVPPEKCLVITNVSVQLSAGAAQNATGFQLELRDDLNNFLAMVWPHPNFTAATGFQNAMMLDILLMPNERLRAAGFFSAGANANTTIVSFFGLMIPRGNLQLR